jgi:hypothetical protein
MRTPLVLQVFFAEAVDPDALDRSRAKLRRYHVERLAKYREFERMLDARKGSYQALRLGIAYQELMIDWIDSLDPLERRVRSTSKISKKRPSR